MQASTPQIYSRNAIRFSLGSVVATPGALELIQQAGISPHELLARHQRGDWGIVPPEDAAANEDALRFGSRLLSSYLICAGERIWIITEADRSSTTLLLPEEY